MTDLARLAESRNWLECWKRTQQSTFLMEQTLLLRLVHAISAYNWHLVWPLLANLVSLHKSLRWMLMHASASHDLTQKQSWCSESKLPGKFRRPIYFAEQHAPFFARTMLRCSILPREMQCTFGAKIPQFGSHDSKMIQCSKLGLLASALVALQT